MTPAANRLVDELRAATVAATFTETARRMGVNRSALSRALSLNRRTRNPSFVTIACAAEALGLELALVPRAVTPEARDLTFCPDGDGGYGG